MGSPVSAGIGESGGRLQLPGITNRPVGSGILLFHVPGLIIVHCSLFMPSFISMSLYTIHSSPGPNLSKPFLLDFHCSSRWPVP